MVALTLIFKPSLPPLSMAISLTSLRISSSESFSLLRPCSSSFFCLISRYFYWDQKPSNESFLMYACISRVRIIVAAWFFCNGLPKILLFLFHAQLDSTYYPPRQILPNTPTPREDSLFCFLSLQYRESSWLLHRRGIHLCILSISVAFRSLTVSENWETSAVKCMGSMWSLQMLQIQVPPRITKLCKSWNCKTSAMECVRSIWSPLKIVTPNSITSCPWLCRSYFGLYVWAKERVRHMVRVGTRKSTYDV